MPEQPWRPLGVDSEEAIAQYDALREGVSEAIQTQLWEWIKAGFTSYHRNQRVSGGYYVLDADFAEHMAQVLSVKIGSVRSGSYSDNLKELFAAVGRAPDRLVVADFVVAHSPRSTPETLEAMLLRSRSAWTVGTRGGHAGLVRRMPEAVGNQMDLLSRTAGSAGAKLVEAWEAVYGLRSNPSHACTMAIRAVEDAAIPLVVPRQDGATLGHVIGQMRNDGDWRLAFTRVPDDEPVGGVPLAMCKGLWFGQHDRHGGVPSAPGSVDQDEAEAAVSLAVSLVHWFTAGMVVRR